jgi:hypothetical protein
VIRHPAIEPDTGAIKENPTKLSPLTETGSVGYKNMVYPGCRQAILPRTLGSQKDRFIVQDWLLIGGYCNFLLYLLSDYDYHIYYYHDPVEILLLVKELLP